MALGGVQVADNVLGIRIDVRAVVIIVFDSLLGRNELADVDCGGLGELFEIVGEVLHLID